MEEIRQSKLVTAEYGRIKKQIDDSTKNNASIIEKELYKKISLLEFHHKELGSRKEKLTPHVRQLLAIKERVQHSIDSFQYPKNICNQCIEIRKINPSLDNDSVQTELEREVDLLTSTELGFRDFVCKLDEQIRQDRETIYALEEDYQRKSNTLKIEKNNKKIKTTDMDINLDQLLPEHKSFMKIVVDHPNTDWKEESERLVKEADDQYDVGLKLQHQVEENLTSKIDKLTKQHTSCIEVFNHLIAMYKDEKSGLESKCSQVNEEIPQQKLNIRNIEDLIAENSSHTKLAQLRLNIRAKSTYAELTKDNVEIALQNELGRLKLEKTDLCNKLSQAVRVLKNLNEKKKQYEKEILAKMDVIKINEVECSPLHSSIYYYSY